MCIGNFKFRAIYETELHDKLHKNCYSLFIFRPRRQRRVKVCWLTYTSHLPWLYQRCIMQINPGTRCIITKYFVLSMENIVTQHTRIYMCIFLVHCKIKLSHCFHGAYQVYCKMIVFKSFII